MARRLHRLLGAIAACALLLGGTPAVAAGPQATHATKVESVQAPPEQGEDQGPVEVLIVQGYVKSIDAENLTLTAPGAPADLPLRLVPDTRFIQEEKDIKRTDVHEGQLVRAALIPMGEEFLAVVVELVPDDEAPNAPATPPGDQGEKL